MNRLWWWCDGTRLGRPGRWQGLVSTGTRRAVVDVSVCARDTSPYRYCIQWKLADDQPRRVCTHTHSIPSQKLSIFFRKILTNSFDAHCYHYYWYSTAIKHPVPDRVKPSFAVFDIRALCHSDAQGWASECPDVKNYKWLLNPHPVWHSMLYNCSHMATVSIKGLRTLINKKHSFWKERRGPP